MKAGERIIIEKGKERTDHWLFEVSVDSRTCEITVDKS